MCQSEKGMIDFKKFSWGVCTEILTSYGEVAI